MNAQLSEVLFFIVTLLLLIIFILGLLFFFTIKNHSSIMGAVEELNAKIDQLQAAVDEKQAQLEQTIGALQQANVALQAELGNSVTPAQTQAAIDRINTVIADVASTPVPGP